MGLLAPLAALLGLEIESIAARARAATIIYGLIGLLVLAGSSFLSFAAWLALADLFGALTAALIMAGLFFLLALAIYLGALIGRGRRQREVADRRRASETGAFLTTAALTALPLAMRSPALLRLGLPAAAIAAFALLRDHSDDE